MASPTFSTTNFNFYLTGVGVTAGNLGDTHEITETYTVEHKTAGSIVDVACASYELVITETGVPKLGDVYVSRTGGTATDMWCMNARLNDLSFQIGPKNTAQLALRYTTLYLAVDPTKEPILPSTVEYTTQSRMTELFRPDYTLPAPSGLDVSTADIGGTAWATGAGRAGKPHEVWQTAIRVRVVRDASLAGSEMADQIGDDVAAYVGKRNLTLFLDFQPKTVECRGISAQKLDNEFYEIVYDFVYDEWAWHDQVPEVYPEDGTPAYEEVSAGVFNFVDVRWRRTTRDTAEFNDIWPVTEQKNYATKGWW